MNFRLVAMTAVLTLGMWGCGSTEPAQAPTPAPGTAVEALFSPFIRDHNGQELNGEVMGSKLAAVRYDSAQREGMSAPLTQAWLEGAIFHGLHGSEPLSGMDFLQMRFVGTLENGTSVNLRIEEIIPGTGADQDLWSYRVSYQDTGNGQWYSLCANPDGSATTAIPLENRWDYRQGVPGGGGKIYDAQAFTFACDGAALAKCARLGYAPWRSVNAVSLEQYHQACTRMLRADFCGDGTSYTADGKWVNLYDALNVQVDTEATWLPEAEWTPAGASCFTAQTRAAGPISCGERLSPSCGLGFSPSTLIISETPPQG